MSDSAAEHEQDTGDGTPTLQQLSDKLDRLARTVAGLISQAHGDASRHEASKLDRPTREVEGTREHALSLQEEIQKALADLRKQEASEKDRAELAAKVGKLERAVEKKPREYRRVSRVMGWVRDDDK